MSLAIPLSNRGADYIHAAYGGDRFKQNQYTMQAGNDVARVIVNPIYKGMGYPAAGINTTSFSGRTRVAAITAPTPYDIKQIKRRGKKVSITKGNKKPAYNAGVEYAADEPSTHAQVLALNTRNVAVKKSFDTMQAKAALQRRESIASQKSQDPRVIQNLKQSPTMITDPLKKDFVDSISMLAFDPTFRGFVEPPSTMAPPIKQEAVIDTLMEEQAPMLTSTLAEQQPTASTGVQQSGVVDNQQDVINETVAAQPKAFVSELPFSVSEPPPFVPPAPQPPTMIPSKRNAFTKNNYVSPQLKQAQMSQTTETATQKKKPTLPSVSMTDIKQARKNLKKPPSPASKKFGQFTKMAEIVQGSRKFASKRTSSL